MGRSPVRPRLPQWHRRAGGGAARRAGIALERETVVAVVGEEPALELRLGDGAFQQARRSLHANEQSLRRAAWMSWRWARMVPSTGPTNTKETTVAGVFACGDAALTMPSVAFAVADGAREGGQIRAPVARLSVQQRKAGRRRRELLRFSPSRWNYDLRFTKTRSIRIHYPQPPAQPKENEEQRGLADGFLALSCLDCGRSCAHGAHFRAHLTIQHASRQTWATPGGSLARPTHSHEQAYMGPAC